MTTHANDPLLHHFEDQWAFARGLTRDLLDSLSDGELAASPESGLGPWWKQFRHVGRVQENYLDALVTGTVRFGVEGTTYSGGASKVALVEYLDRLDKRLAGMIKGGFPHETIDWFGKPKSAAQHLLCLADHEVLHHGQWVIYRKLLGGLFPKSWAAWGL